MGGAKTSEDRLHDARREISDTEPPQLAFHRYRPSSVPWACGGLLRGPQRIAVVHVPLRATGCTPSYIPRREWDNESDAGCDTGEQGRTIDDSPTPPAVLAEDAGVTSDGLFHIDRDGRLASLTVTPYAAEDVLQELLETHPDLLAGGQMSPEEPRRWALVRREHGVPDHEAATGSRWSVDHLFVDQDAVPTLVEVKRSSDTRIRREVVGQMLDYAANGVRYWPVADLRSAFEATQRAVGRDPEEEIAELTNGEGVGWWTTSSPGSGTTFVPAVSGWSSWPTWSPTSCGG